MRCVDGDIDKDIQSLDARDIHGDETRVSVVNQEITAQRTGGVVVYTACSVRNVAHDEGLEAWAELNENVGDGGREEKKTLGHLQGDLLGPEGPDAMDGLRDLKVVVGREEGNGFFEGGVF